MRILVACEESQAVTIELRALGHEAFSADIQECSGGHPEWHLCGDVLKVLNNGWDMVIAFPPCTHLAVSGARHFEQKIKDGRQQEGIDFFMEFVNCNAEKVCIENPIGIMSEYYRKPDQIIQPWQFGHGETKATCLWLKKLNPLKPTDIVEGRADNIYNMRDETGKLVGWNTDLIKKLRSKTFPGIAKAMALQFTTVKHEQLYFAV